MAYGNFLLNAAEILDIAVMLSFTTKRISLVLLTLYFKHVVSMHFR